MDQDKKIVAIKKLVKGMGQALSLSRLYSFDHPVVKTKAKEVFGEVTNFISDNGTLVFSESPEATLLVNGEELKSEDSLTARFIQNFRKLKTGSIDLVSKLTFEEFCVFIDLLNNADDLKEKDSIKEFLKSKKITHVLPSFASYKLVDEHETITKEGNVIRIKDLPPGALQSFTSDLNIGGVSKKIKEGNQTYQVLAHDPESLSQVVIGNIKHKNERDELTEVLWLIGDYLIDEIQSVKQEEINSGVLNDLKDRLLVLCEEEHVKIPPTEEVVKTFTTINAALQIKGLVSLYKRNRKDLVATIDKLKNIIKNLPPQSQLYRKAKEDWNKIDHTNPDVDLF